MKRGFFSLFRLPGTSFFCLVLIFLFTTNAYADTKVIPLLTYHIHAPFITAKNEGLTYKLAEYLTEQSSGKYSFIVKPMSRTRVNKLLEESAFGVIPWVSPVWFDDVDKKKYLWSNETLMQDANAVLSNISMKINYDGLESIDGLTFGGVRGHHYEDIDAWVSQGRLKRIDAEKHTDNFRKLVRKRIDFTITPHKGAIQIIKEQGFENDIYISKQFHSTYNRRFIIVDENKEIQMFLDKALIKLNKEPAWQVILNALP